jgi:SAM-dependent methyltransferase
VTDDFWAQGDYHEVARRLQPAADGLVRAAGIGPGDRVLDVAAGTGNVAVAAARAGADVVASDLSPTLVARGRERCHAVRADVAWRVADAMALPFRDGEFDAALSAFGVIFAASAATAVSELFRVVRADGVVGVAIWSTGFQGDLGKAIGSFVAGLEGESAEPDPGPRPGTYDEAMDWSSPDEVVSAFAPHAVTVEVVPGSFGWYFDSFDDWRTRAERVAPPLVALLQRLDEAQAAELRSVIERAARPYLRPIARGIVIEQAYTSVVARKL